MVGTVTRAADLVAEVTFLGFCSEWEAQGRCSFAFSDYLREWGLEEQADTADWAHKYKDRPDYTYTKRLLGPTPRFQQTRWLWWAFQTEDIPLSADDLLVEYDPEYYPDLLKEHKTFPEAIAALLDHYRGWKTLTHQT